MSPCIVRTLCFIFIRARTLNVDIRFLGFNYTSLSINRAILPFPTTAFLPAALHVLHGDFHNPIHVVFLTVNVIQDLKRTLRATILSAIFDET